MACLGSRDKRGIGCIGKHPVREADEVEEFIQPLVSILVAEAPLDQLKGLLQDSAVGLVAPAGSVLLIP